MQLPYNRLVVGLCLKGDYTVLTDGTHLVFSESFPTKHKAEAHAKAINGEVKGYLSGRYKRGWSVLVRITPTERLRFRDGYDVQGINSTSPDL